MWAAVLQGPRAVAVEERPVPELGPHDVLLAVSHCGICGSDLHLVLDGWGRPGSIEGHEFSGRVVAVGDAVTEWRVGDDVVGGPATRCGACEYCRAGRPSLCTRRDAVGESDTGWQGAFAEYTKVPERELLRLPAGMSLRTGALAEPLAVALHGLSRGGVAAGSRVLVIGAGPIGALSVAACVARGVAEVVVSEPAPKRRALAEALGATVVTPEELVTPASPYSTVSEPFDVALECSGNGRGQESALAQLKRAGTLVLVGAGMARPKFDPNRILLNELTITGAYVYDHDGFPRALELLASGKMPNDLLVEQEDYPLNRLLDAAVGLHEGELAAKAMIVPRVD